MIFSKQENNFWQNYSILDLNNFQVRLQYGVGAPVAQMVKRWPTDLADRVQSSLKVKSSQP